MTVFKKLMNVRMKLQDEGVRKSGFNPNAEFWYYELDDFLPRAMKMFNEEGLCPVVSFTRELATLTIHSIEDGTSVMITSPFGDAQMPGCSEIQNIGSSETYSRRYLYLAALEIVEKDTVDATKKDGAATTESTAKKDAAKPAPEGKPSGTADQTVDNEEDIQRWLETVEKVSDLNRLNAAEDNLKDFFKSDAAKERVRTAIAARKKALQPA